MISLNVLLIDLVAFWLLAIIIPRAICLILNRPDWGKKSTDFVLSHTAKLAKTIGRFIFGGLARFFGYLARLCS